MAIDGREDPREVKARFDELIADEFGEGWIPTLDDEPITFDPHEPKGVEVEAPKPSFRFPDARGPAPEELADVDDDEDFELPPQEPMAPPSSATIAIWLALAYSVAVGFAMLFGVILPPAIPWTGLLAFVGALVAAFIRLPRDRDSSPDDGAVV